MSLPYIFVAKYRLVAALVDGPYNPPQTTDEAAWAKFEEEYSEFRKQVRAVLARRGREDPYGHGDFSVGHCIAPSRGVGVALKSYGLITAPLLAECQGLVDAFPESYVITITAEKRLGQGCYICIAQRMPIHVHASRRTWIPECFRPNGQVE